MAAVADDHHRQRPSPRPAAGGQLEHLRRLDQADRLVVQQRSAASPFERRGSSCGRASGSGRSGSAGRRTARRRSRTSRARMTDIVIGSWRMNRVPLPGRLLTRTDPPTACTMLCTTSSPTPRPEISVTAPWSRSRGGRGSRAARPRSAGRPSRRVARPLLDDLGAEPLEVDPPAVVARG